MTVRLETTLEQVRIVDQYGELTPAIKSTLRLRGFSRTEDGLAVVHYKQDDLVLYALDLLNGTGAQIELDAATEEVAKRREKAGAQLRDSRHRGEAIRRGDLTQLESREFLKFMQGALKRHLLPHQVKAALHLVNVAHGANFSVPGAGKTSVVLAAYEFLRLKGHVNALFVVGPRSCFMPWRTEFAVTLGRQPTVEIVAGGDIRERRQRYYPKYGSEVDLYLTTYQTLSHDKQQVHHLLKSYTNRIFFVIDEAHYMKQDDGVWANAVAETSRNAYKRCVLTGTPFPKSYADGVNQFDVLYPNSGIFGRTARRTIRHASESGDHSRARVLLESRIDGLYYRVRKSDLGLSAPVFVPPIQVEMNPIERELYDCIEKRIGELEETASDRDLDTITTLKRGRQIRRRQATSYSALLLSAIGGYDELLIDPENDRLNEKILTYDIIETPAKLQRLMQEVKKLQDHQEKVVVWANFVGTLHKIKDECDRANMESRVVYGGTPMEDGMDEDGREAIIETFKDRASGLDVLIANPAACAESVSLHKTCSNAIYYDLSYNCAEYLQSLDRIHRVGGSEKKTSNYRFLQYADTFEHEILANLTEKSRRMADVVDQNFPLALSELRDLGIDVDGIIV